MPLGSALLRPQGLKEAPADGPSRAIELLVDFVETLMQDPEGAKAMGSALAQSGGEILPAFLYSRLEKLRLAEGHIRQIAAPFADLIHALTGGIQDGVAESVPAVIGALRGVTVLLQSDNAVRMLKDLMHCAMHDLDLNGPAVEDLFRRFAEGAVTRLQAGVNGGDLSEQSLAHYELGVCLRNLEVLVLDELDMPSLDIDAMADALGKLYQRAGIDGFLVKLGNVLAAAQSLAEPLGLLLETMLADPDSSTGGSVGAAAASKRAARKLRSVGAAGDPGSGGGSPGSGGAGGAGGTGGSGGSSSSSSSTDPSDQVSWYATWALRRPTYFTVDESTTRLEPAQALTFKHITPLTMERIAFHTLWATDLLETLLHIISAEQGDIATNLLNSFWGAFNVVNTPVNKWAIPTWVQWLSVNVLTLGGSMESVRCSGGNDAVYPLTEVLGDFGEVMLYKRWTWLMREFLMSILTLINHDPDVYGPWKAAEDAIAVQAQGEIDTLQHQVDDTSLAQSARDAAKTQRDQKQDDLAGFLWRARQGNVNQFQGLCYGMAELGGLILPGILSETDRLNYGFIGGGPTGPMVGKAFGGMGISMVFNYGSLLIARILAGQFPDDTAGMVLLPLKERFFWNAPDRGAGGIAGRVILDVFNGVVEWALQVIYLYLFTNNNTSGGTFSAISGPYTFPGYPSDSGNSPYKLPWAGGVMKECVQNNMGIWSHYPNSGQAYAYDYNHDAGNEVVCSRTGIVSTLTQNQINNNTQNWNTIETVALDILGAGASGSVPAVPPPTGLPPGGAPNITKYTDTPGTSIEAGTLFPPWWDVNGNPWPTLPQPMPLLPSGAILPVGTALGTGIAAASTFRFINPAYDRGLNGVTYPAGANFSDGTTAIPPGVVFAPDAPNPPTLVTPMYRAGTTFAPMQNNFTAAPFSTAVAAGAGTAGFTPAAGATFLDGVALPAGVILPPDCAATPAWMPKPHPATPLYLPGTTFTPITNTGYFNAGTTFVAAGSTFPAIPASVPPGSPAGTVPTLNLLWFTPVAFTFCQYGHAIQNFTKISAQAAVTGQPSGTLTDVFSTNVNADIIGMLVNQGRVIMLSGDTGVSAYNHLHTHVLVDSSSNQRLAIPYALPTGGFNILIFTIPFVYADAKHDIRNGFREALRSNGVPYAMTWYVSENTRTGP
jgi:hypothetical protein